MESLSFEQMENVQGGVSRAERNAGCAALGLSAGLATLALAVGPIIGGLTTMGCMLITDYDR
ncbi:Blp family class II bacteriocin [uncultured Dysgonomonas sp.]|uniref:Blp family class II bacteriocin n=1 Tax=uncultured Dysgonomonas sp. TaxID=206096 RepID=UPI002804B5CC|nr:Blp family class II bacteriocin [uncultured Dysgonomonas sp.]